MSYPMVKMAKKNTSKALVRARPMKAEAMHVDDDGIMVVTEPPPDNIK